MILFLVQLLIIVVCLYSIWLFSYSLFFGAPYAALGEKKLAKMIALAKIKNGERACDLGSGDGRIVIALAHAGAVADGLEINPILHLLALQNLRKKHVGENAHVFLRDLWKTNLSKYDVITLYGNFPMMARLEKKLQKELRPGARVISNHFQFPHWKSENAVDDIFVYSK